MLNLKSKSALLALVLLPFTTIEAAWSTPVAISSTVSDQPDIAVDLAGNATAVWQGFDGSSYVIQSSSLPVSGSWSSPTTLSSSSEDAQGPEVAVDASGNAVTIWSRYDGSNSIVQGTTLPFSSSWTTPVDISDAGQNADSVELAMDFSGTVGNAVAVWHRYNGANFIIQGSTLPSGGSWTTPYSISVSGQDALVPEVAVDPSGNAAVICSRFNGTNFTTRSATQLYGQTWSASVILSNPGQAASTQSIALDASGNATASWDLYDGTNHMVQVSTKPFGSSWSSATTISTTGNDAYIPQVAVDPAGDALVIWVEYNGTNFIAQAATKPASGSWSSPVTISDSGVDVFDFSLKLDSAGNAVAVWDESDGVNSVIVAASLPSGGSWTTPVPISTSGNYAYLPVVGVDSSGNAVAIWLESNGSNYVVTGATHLFGS